MAEKGTLICSCPALLVPTAACLDGLTAALDYSTTAHTPLGLKHTDRRTLSRGCTKTLSGSQESILSGCPHPCPRRPKVLPCSFRRDTATENSMSEKSSSPQSTSCFSKKSTREKQRDREAVFPERSLPGPPPATH